MSKITSDHLLGSIRSVDPTNKINYDNSLSLLAASNVKEAIDEMATNQFYKEKQIIVNQELSVVTL
jgi:hypothetical protein